MISSTQKVFRNVLRVLGTIAVIGYLLFLFGEGVPLFNEPTFADISVYLLFLIFMIGYYFIWTKEIVAGLVWIVWHGIQWCLVMWVWPDGAMTLVIGFPIFILGVLLLIYGIKSRRRVRATEHTVNDNREG